MNPILLAHFVLLPISVILSMELAVFVFSDWSENTYILYDSTGECCIVDPGCSTAQEKTRLTEFITAKGLKPVKLVNTHCHIDHVLGNRHVSDTYDLPLVSHKGEQVVLGSMSDVARIYNMPYTPSPDITEFLDEGDILEFGETKLEVLFTPGHSPASISFFHRPSMQLIGGDVLFDGSIGRTDLPGADHATLIASIKNKLFPLGDGVKVYSGHGPATTIGKERRTNPFLV